jgi:glycosyltransferase 2 family protein
VLALCAACYVAFFLVSAALIYALAHVLGFAFDEFPTLVAATCASWFAGFVVIGAPAGLGVREAVFVALTGAALGEDRALLVIGLFRIVTFLGDTLFFAAGAALARLSKNPS